MRLPVATAKLIERRSDEQDAFALANEVRGLINQRAEYWLEMQTTNATPAVIWTDELPANSVVKLTAHVVAVNADATEAAGYERVATFRRPGTGAAVQVGTTSAAVTDENIAGWNVTCQASATAGFIEVSVTGEPAETIFWRANVIVLVLPWQ